jgi:uncharacterized protein YdaU (DUF1376 family)
MHYYKRNLGDYAKKAGRLTMLQHGSYTLLIDSCYDRETFPTLEQALEWTWASTEAEVEAVKFVLNRFFTLDKDGCYVQDRILQELLEYHAKADTNKRIAIERETKRKEKSTNREQDVNEAPPNHKPLTINQKPQTNIKPPTALSVRFDEFWKVYPKKIGKDAAKKAFDKRKPDQAMFDTMLNAIHFQRSSDAWQRDGGQYIPNPATWLNQGRWQDEVTNFKPVDLIHQTTPTPPNQDAALRKIEADAKKATPVPESVRLLAKQFKVGV